MSDFSYSAICPYCHGRFAPDDGYCTCWGAEQAGKQEKEEDEEDE